MVVIGVGEFVQDVDLVCIWIREVVIVVSGVFLLLVMMMS